MWLRGCDAKKGEWPAVGVEDDSARVVDVERCGACSSDVVCSQLETPCLVAAANMFEANETYTWCKGMEEKKKNRRPRLRLILMLILCSYSCSRPSQKAAVMIFTLEMMVKQRVAVTKKRRMRIRR